MIGVPLTVGFVSKWYLIQSALEKGAWGWPIAALVLTTSLMAVIYIWRVVEAAYFQDSPEEEGGGVAEAPYAMLIPTWALVVANFYFGINATFTHEVAASAARSLMGMAP